MEVVEQASQTFPNVLPEGKRKDQLWPRCEIQDTEGAVGKRNASEESG